MEARKQETEATHKLDNVLNDILERAGKMKGKPLYPDNNGPSLVEITSKDVDGDVEVVWSGTPDAFLSLLEFWAASEVKQR